MTDKHETTPPVDPATLPDPEDITEDDLGQAPPRPESKKKRRFGGTHRQIRSAQKLYKFTAWLTGIFLLLLVLQMIVKYGFGRELFAGGTTEDGTEFMLGLYHEQAVVEGVNISLIILIVHGWLYVLYLLACFRLWSMMRWVASDCWQWPAAAWCHSSRSSLNRKSTVRSKRNSPNTPKRSCDINATPATGATPMIL